MHPQQRVGAEDRVGDSGDIKEAYIKVATNSFQIGGVTGHRHHNHNFSIKSVVGKYTYNEKVRETLAINSFFLRNKT